MSRPSFVNSLQIAASVRFLGLLAMLCLTGCSEEVVQYPEMKRPDEVLLPEEWQVFVRIVDQLPDSKLTKIRDFQPPLPQWQGARTLPVDELAIEERAGLDQASNPENLATELLKIPGLPKLLQDENLSADQFAGITIALGAAIRRSSLGEEFPLETMIKRGKASVSQLLQDHRLFASLSIEERHRVLDSAVWLHRVDRAERFRSIPQENTQLAKQNWKWLKSVLPPSFFAPPFADVVDVQEEEGIPFIEAPNSDSDREIDWNPAEAIVGTAS